MREIMTIEDSIAGVMPEATKLVQVHKSINIEAEKNYAIQQLYKNDYSSTAALNFPSAVQNSVRNLASIGISLNPALKHAYLVPRDGQICLDIGYMGLLHLAQQEGSILWGQASIVYANDNYINNGLGERPTHNYQAFGDRGAPVGVYCCVKLPNGDYLTEEMDAQQIEAVKQTSKAIKNANTPWNKHPLEMWRKTVVKRGSKYWPKSGSRLDSAIEVLNQHEGLADDAPRVEKEVKDVGLSVEEKQAQIEAEMNTKIDTAKKLIERGGSGFTVAMRSVHADITKLCGKLKVHPAQYTEIIKEIALDGIAQQENNQHNEVIDHAG